MISLRLMAVVLAVPLASTLITAQQPPQPTPPVENAPKWPRTYPTGESTTLGARIAELLRDPAASRAHWGIAVTAIDGTPIYGLDESKLFRPASTAKLFTTTAAMALLGPGRRFTTRLMTEGTVTAGVLNGNLVLVGGGDATFASGIPTPYTAPNAPPPATPYDPLAGLNDLAARVAASGITKIQGDIIGNDRYFEWDPYPEGWEIEDMLWGYGAPASALAFHDDDVQLTLTAPPKPGDPTSAVFDPAVPFYTLTNTARSTSTEHGPEVSIRRKPDSKEIRISGTLASSVGAFHTSIAIEDPATFAAVALRYTLEQHGVTVTGSARPLHWTPEDDSFDPRARVHLAPATVRSMLQPTSDANCAPQSAAAPGAARSELTQHTSAPLLQDIVITAKVSQNQHAEIILRDIAAAKGCQPTLQEAIAWQREFLLAAGLDGTDFIFYDGSGLSTKDLVAPRAEAELLAYAAQQPWFAQWKTALPVAGIDGTLASRFTDSPLKGHVFAKTGSLGETRALAGYVDCASGKQVIFSIMVDNHEPGSSDDRTAMDKIVEVIAASN